ncbi:MAG: sporulation integral membrane protein YlbJ [Clostridia bacterium]|nr:sporulation integral membrane protein YlbJ [Clostridia bacterium]
MKHFYIFKLKQLIFPFVLVLFTACLIVFSKTNLLASKNGLVLWANSIVPSLFPFFVATELLSHTNFTYYLGKLLNKFMKPVFNVRGEGSFAFIMGILSGYPIGAKIAANFRENNICTKEECERLLSFTNNSGPLFIIGTVGISMFGNSSIGFLLLITHLLASITVGIIFRFWKYKADSNTSCNSFKVSNNDISLSNLGGIIGNSITTSINTILLIGGFVVLFSVIISILQTSHILYTISDCVSPLLHSLHIPSNFADGLICGILELTNGLNVICNIHERNLSINIILASFLLGLGGLSVLLQVWSTISKTDLSIKPYILGKLLHSCISAFYTFLFLQNFVFFNFDL